MKKILIIRFSSIGDIVLTSPLVRSLKKQLGDEVAIHYLTKEQFRPLLENNPYISKIHTITKSNREVIHLLRSEKYDHIIDLHKNYRSFGIWMCIRSGYSTFRKLNFKKWILVRFKINLLPDIHIVDRYFRAVSFLGIKNDLKGLDYFINEKEDISMEVIPEIFRRGYTAFVIGAHHETKCFPEDMVVAVCQRLNKPVILIGGPGDKEKGDRIKAAAGEHVMNACGSFNLNQSARILQKAHKVITNDTGMMHIAAAFRRPILSLWGNTVPAFGMYPYLSDDTDSDSVIMEVCDLSCRPCSKLGYERCPKGHFNCMRLIDIESIAEWANKKIVIRNR
ncbi:MAG: glycosyltransferase family 9 protein [Bacteroidetes bacterium]|nr:glycosyltransferase family 9 protein [Bacteroidota bacterium]